MVKIVAIILTALILGGGVAAYTYVKNGEQKNQVERRQGLVDRSKTPFWLVNNADYELVQ